MSKRAVTVDLETSLAEARKLMAEHAVRHLPVLDGPKIVGLLSERDLGRLEGFSILDINLVSVPDAMSADPYVVAPDTPVVDVVRQMRKKRYGSVIVAEGDRVVGMFTTMDALGLLGTMLDPRD